MLLYKNITTYDFIVNEAKRAREREAAARLKKQQQRVAKQKQKVINSTTDRSGALELQGQTQSSMRLASSSDDLGIPVPTVDDEMGSSGEEFSMKISATNDMLDDREHI